MPKPDVAAARRGEGPSLPLGHRSSQTSARPCAHTVAGFEFEERKAWKSGILIVKYRRRIRDDVSLGKKAVFERGICPRPNLA